MLPVKAGWSTGQRKDVEGDPDRGQRTGLWRLGRKNYEVLRRFFDGIRRETSDQVDLIRHQENQQHAR